ncbi:MAG: hypothetical protein K2O03_12675 [Lachnospiraceae bacterium]|nr:hypothetical protein [Lachnospiraceae bacterium]
MKRRRTGKMAGLLFAGALLFAACGKEDGDVGKTLPGEDLTVSGEATPLPTAVAAQERQPSEGEEKKTGQTVSDVDAVPVLAQEDAVPVTEAYFPDEAFREYLLAYVDKDRDKKLSKSEREAIEGLGSTKKEGGLSDGAFLWESNMKRGEKLRAIKSLEGIGYFVNLKEICFAGGYKLEKLPLDNPNLEMVQLETYSLQDFSIGDAPKLQSLEYVVTGGQDIAWDKFPELTELKINGDVIEIEKLAKCETLTLLSLSGCTVMMPENPEAFGFPRLSTLEFLYCDVRVPENLEVLSFSRLPFLETFHFSESKDQETILAKELDFGKNEYLREVAFGDKKMAERIILGNMDTYFSAGADWAGCEIVFEEETMLETEKALPEGSIWLTAENFPDVAFRQYLYYYADQDKNHILSKTELSSVRELNVWDDNPTFSFAEQARRKEMLQSICYFDGIQYLEDLRTFCLDYDSAAVSLCLNHPRLLELSLPDSLKEFSIQNPESLQSLYFNSKEGLEIDLSGMCALRNLNLRNVSADFTYLLQNKYMARIRLEDCVNLGETLEEYDFSGMKALAGVDIVPKAGTQLWAERMRFEDSGYFSEDPDAWRWVRLGENVTKKVILENKNIHCSAGGAEIVYLDDAVGENVEALPEGSIWNGTEKIPDMNLRCYLNQKVDANRDNILTLQERESLRWFLDTGYDYDYGPFEEINEFKWKMEDDFNPYVYGITSLRGFEYFPKLERLQLEKLKLSEDVTEIVITNPELEVLDLRFNGNVEIIDLTACKKLRICVIDSSRDADFVQEVKPTILLPEHLQLETVEGMDCLIGEKAQERFRARRK